MATGAPQVFEVAPEGARGVPGRLWSHVDRTSDCWIWTGAVNPKGYGVISLTAEQAIALGLGRRRLAAKAHRVSMALAGHTLGSNPVLHHCDNPPCVRPDHLYVGTPKQNMEDRAKRNPGSFVRGAANGATRLSAADVAEIRRLAGTESMRALGRRYGVTHAAIRKVISGASHPA